MQITFCIYCIEVIHACVYIFYELGHVVYLHFGGSYIYTSQFKCDMTKVGKSGAPHEGMHAHLPIYFPDVMFDTMSCLMNHSVLVAIVSSVKY